MNNILKGSSFGHYIFGESFLYEELKDKLNDGANKIELGGQLVNFHSVRLRTFIEKGNTCVSCKRVGTTFRLQKDRAATSFHVGLWSDDGVQMTKDHIHPDSKGGKDSITNMQCMCEICNQAKGNKPGKINSTAMIMNSFPDLEKFKSEIISFNKEYRVNALESIIEFSQFQSHYDYFMNYGIQIWDYLGGLPSKNNKYWLRVPPVVRNEIVILKGVSNV